MANNYQYIVAGLPQLTLNFEEGNFSFESIKESIYVQCSAKDRRLIDWLLFGLDDSNMNNHFYREIKKVKNNFLKEYFTFDLEVRNIIAAWSARESQKEPSEYLIGDSEVTESLRSSKSHDFGLTGISDNAPAVIKALEDSNILAAEQAIDRLRWEKSNQIIRFNYFDIDVILSFLIRCYLVERWSKLDKKQGAELLKQLVDEVRGTFSISDINKNK